MHLILSNVKYCKLLYESDVSYSACNTTKLTQAYTYKSVFVAHEANTKQYTLNVDSFIHVHCLLPSPDDPTVQQHYNYSRTL